MSSESPRRAKPVAGGARIEPGEVRTEKGWRANVDALYRERADRLIGHFSSGTADREMVRDVVHEAFAKLAALNFARRVALLRPDAYLYRMCANLMRDRARAQRTQYAHREQQRRSQDRTYCPLAELEHRDTLRRLERAILRLRPKTREIFLAKRLDGLTYAEIAVRTGLTVKGVEKHMSKAIAAIGHAMERDRS